MTDKRFKPEKADVLFSAERKALLPVDEVIKHLNLGFNDIVADLGAGNGYFTIPIAKSTNQFVYAVDIEPKMLEMLKVHSMEAKLDNIDYLVSDLENIRLDDDSVDKVIIAFVIHEVPNMNQALNEIKRILKPDGQVLFIEWEATETEAGPPLAERIPSEEMVKILRKHNFEVEVIQLNPVNYAVKAISNQ